MRASLASYSPKICPTTNCESLQISTTVTPNCVANPSPVMTASYSISLLVAGNSKRKTVEITLRTIGPSPPSRLTVPSSIRVHDLRKLIAGDSHLPIDDMRLIFRGNVLLDNKNGDAAIVQLHDGESLIVAIKPEPPAKHIWDDVDEDDSEDLKFQLPQPTGRYGLSSLYGLFWHPVAQRLDVGPLYILGTGFAIIFYNLGHRQPGDVSAYSVFNEDFRELPGTLNADRLDRDIRAGQF
ncbi:ubiquitin family protein [Abeliophyllum distichum]|uniref:Ubiquitin family protein n=1 Tax=Abeliophyllum distichum TaxID=126358 RepID=A0ABD1TZD3_9LAMI